jgi:hypothetical protein
MRRSFLITILCIFLFGCGQAARESGFYNHDTMYKDWDHLSFSWVGYKNITAKDVKESEAENWWGIPEGTQTTK